MIGNNFHSRILDTPTRSTEDFHPTHLATNHLVVKLAATASDRDTRHLRWLAERVGLDLADSAVITTGPEAYYRSDSIAVIPAALLTD